MSTMSHQAVTPAQHTSGVTRTNLDLLRAVAILMVLADHTAYNLHHQFIGSWDMGNFGVFGVYLFFVHTCLVLMWSLERRPHTLDFYVRRIFRIYPLVIVTVLILAIFRPPLFPRELLSTKMVIKNLLLVQDMTGAFFMEGVLWSLPLEMHMYLFLPGLFLFARRERTFWTLLLLWGFAILLARSIYGPANINVFLTVIPDFLPGVIAYVAYKRFAPRWPAWAFPFLLLAGCVFYMNGPTLMRSWIFCLALGFGLPLFRELQQRTVVRISHELAKYSYGVYLLHPLALFIAFGYMQHRPLWMKVGTELLLIPLFAVAAYHVVEEPLIGTGSRVAQRLQSKFGTDPRADYGLDLI